jgi:cell division protein FtsI/penicillin-binding protein 2
MKSFGKPYQTLSSYFSQRPSRTNRPHPPEGASMPVNLRARLLTVIGIIVLLFLGICIKLIKMDSVQSQFLNAQSDQQSIHRVIIPAKRGMIFDRNGIPLAISTPMYTLVLDPKALLSEPMELERLLYSPLMRPFAQQLYAEMRARPNSRYLLVAKNLTPWARAQIKGLGIPGVYLEQTYKTFSKVKRANCGYTKMPSGKFWAWLKSFILLSQAKM